MPGGSDSGNPGYPEAGGHPNTFVLLAFIAIEIASLASLVAVTKYTLARRSGLDEVDKLHRIWSRAPEIRFQPVAKPLLFAVGVGYGAQTVLYTLLVAVAAFLGFQGTAVIIFGIVMGLFATGASSFIAVVTYRATGGQGDWKVPAGACFGFISLMFWLCSWSLGLYGSLSRQIDGVNHVLIWISIYIFPVIILFLLQLPFAMWAANKGVPTAARLIYNSTVVPNWVKLDRTILVAAAPLAVVRIFAYFVQSYMGHGTYLTGLATSLSSLMLLAMSALAAMISVNRALLANEFQWQWRAFLTPAVPLTTLDILFALWELLRGKAPFWLTIYQVLHLFLSYGSCGALGAYTYLTLAERYAQGLMDDDTLAQQDILNEFDQDEDNEELNV